MRQQKRTIKMVVGETEQEIEVEFEEMVISTSAELKIGQILRWEFNSLATTYYQVIRFVEKRGDKFVYKLKFKPGG